MLLIFLTPSIRADEKTLFSTLSTSTERKIRQSEKYLTANLYQHRHNYPKALRLFNELLMDGASPYIYDGYLRLLSQMNQFPTIVNLIDKTKKFFSDDLEIQLIYAQSLINTNNDAQAEKFLLELKKKHPDNAHVTYFLAAQHEKNNKLERAHRYVSEFLNKHKNHPRRFLFLFFLAKLLFKMGNTSGSLDAVNKSIKLYPKFDQGLLFKAFLLEKTNQIDKAIECYKDASMILKKNVAINKHLVQLLLAQKRYNEAIEIFKKLESTSISGSKTEYLYHLALIEFEAKKYNDSLTTIEKALKQNHSHKKTKLLKVEVLLALKQKKQVLNIMKNWLIASPNDNAIINALISLSTRGLTFDDIGSVLEIVGKKHPKKINITVARADLFLQNGDQQKALELYQRALKYSTDTMLQAKLRYQISFIYFSIGKKMEAQQDLEKAMAQKIVYPSAFNLAAQILEQKGENLEKAHLYINKALQTNQHSPYFLDTQGTIFYRQKKYNDAIKSFNKALQYAPKNQIIKHHLRQAQDHGKR
jgi:tetratricopeptide (TPR) repeat protein